MQHELKLFSKERALSNIYSRLNRDRSSMAFKMRFISIKETLKNSGLWD